MSVLVGVLLSHVAFVTGAAPTAHALLIGVGDYPDRRNTGVAQLHGTRNDINLIREVLTSRFLVAKSNIRTLIDKEATHTAVEKAFHDLTTRVRPGDIVYIHFAGHGSYAPDEQERRKQVQTWITYGARSRQFSAIDRLDVVDKELAVWLKPLYELTDDVIFVSDSCHSATVSKGLRSGVRFTQPTGLPHPLVAKLPRVPEPTTGVRVGSARDHETALELNMRTGTPCDDSRDCHGVFSWHWARALADARPGDTWAHVFSRVFARVTTTNGISQRPQINGRSDRLVFGGGFSQPPKVFAVSRVLEPGKVLLSAGALSGVTNDSEFELDRSDRENTTPLPKLRIVKTGGWESEAKVLSGQFRIGDLVKKTRHVYQIKPLRLFVTGDLAKKEDLALVADVTKTVRAAIDDQLSAYSIATDADSADLWLYVSRADSSRSAVGAPPHRLPDFMECGAGCPPPVVWAVSKQGILMHERLRVPFSESEAPAKLVERLREFAWAQEVLRLGGQGNAIAVDVAVTFHRLEGGGRGKCDESGSEKWRQFGPFPLTQLTFAPALYDCISFAIANKDPSRTWYASLVAVMPSLSVQPIFPPPGGEADVARIEPNTRYEPKRLFYALDQPGLESIILLVSASPVETMALEQFARRGPGKSHISRLLGAGMRRRGSLASEVADWGSELTQIAVPGSHQP